MYQAPRILTPARPFQNAWRSLQRKRSGRTEYNVLGICSTGHGASLALASSRYGIRALNLDRFLRKKYAILLGRCEHQYLEERRGPIFRGLRFLLSDKSGNLPPVMVFEDGWRSFFQALVHGLPLQTGDIDLVVASECHFAVNRVWLGRSLSRIFPNAVVHTDIEHHAIHRFQAFLASPFEEAAILTLDACGEALGRLRGGKLAITLSEFRGGEYQILAEHTFPDSSPGRVYQAFNDYLGFEAGEEGKTMGLSSFGRDTCYQKLAPHLKLREDGSFRFLSTADLGTALLAMGALPRQLRGRIYPIHEDVAAAAQKLLDDIVTNAMQALRRRSALPDLCMAGGVALNSVSNERGFRASGFEQLYVMPNAGDCGQALGCALYGQALLTGVHKGVEIAHDGLGPVYTDEEVLAAFRRAGLEPERPEDLSSCVAGMIASRQIVGWFQGGSEYGPRALGNRSILADPRPADMTGYLNRQVKFREPFRPYAPAVLVEEAGQWFDLRGPSPFMLRVVDVLPEKRTQIAAVTHVDGTARVQTVERTTNPRFYDLIAAFRGLTGVPILLNTSFNVAGQPIVETPTDAVECFLSTKIDALVMHDWVVRKSGVQREEEGT